MRTGLAWARAFPRQSGAVSAPAAAEIRLEHPRVARHRGRRPLADDLAVMQHDEPLRGLHDGLHHVLHPEQPDPALVADASQDGGGARALGGGEPGQQLVQQDHPRPHRQRHGQLEQLAAPPGEPPRRHRGLLAHLDEGQQLGRGASWSLAPARGRGHVLGRGQVEKGPRGLEGAPQAEPGDPVGRHGADQAPAHPDGSGRRPEQPVDQVEEGGLSGPVRPDEGHDLALGHLEAHPMEDPQAPEAACDVGAFEEGPRHSPTAPAAGRGASPRRSSRSRRGDPR